MNSPYSCSWPAAKRLRGLLGGLNEAMDVEIDFPIEFNIRGIPVSSSVTRADSRDEWKERVRSAARLVLPEGHFVSDGRMSVTIYYFPGTAMQGDVDNIVKWILDALNKLIWFDDHQVERVTVQKFEPGRVFPFSSPSDGLRKALSSAGPIVHVRVSDDPSEELM